ncbi:MAG: helix-turn-helix domain-containing protein [Desulfosporosinus sp.]|nr:helix-turn-helix domain-containing protein [Desulfosporosinus sp.]MBC2726286.1 helix-turn-helix domain-containing protein [Desulfosporosinus sp.]
MPWRLIVKVDKIKEILERSAARLREIRESTGLSQKDFAESFGANKTTYNRYESGDIKSMPSDLIGNISDKFDLNPAWLMGYENVDKYMIREKANQSVRRLPVLGKIAAGIPILAQEDLIDYEYVPESIKADFCLKVQGDSMIGARILDGDLVYIRQQSDVETGEIAAVLIDGLDATLKRVYRINGSIILRSENPNYPEQVYGKKDNVTILGKAILFKSEVR